MDNKDQLNQIPGEDAENNRDEKTSQTENQNVEAPQETDENPDKAEKLPDDGSLDADSDSPVTDETVSKTQTDVEDSENQAEEIKDEAAPVHDADETAEKPEDAAKAGEASAGEQSGEPEGQPEKKSEPKTEVEPDVIQEEPVSHEADDEVADQDVPAGVKSEELQTQPEETKVPEAPETETSGDDAPAVEKPESKKTDEASGDEVKPGDDSPKVIEEDTAEKDTEETEKAEPSTNKPTVEASEADSENEQQGEENESEDEDEDEEDVDPDAEIDYETLSRHDLVAQLEELVSEDDVNEIKSRVALIKVSYLKKTKAEKEAHIDQTLSKEKDDSHDDAEETAPVEDPLEIKFNELFDIYKQKRAVFLENLEKEKVENLQKKKDILDELKNLIGSEETLKKTYDDFKELQGRWKDIGMVPKSEVNNLWQNYHFLVEKFFDKVKINKELKDLDLKKNLEQKIELCEKAEELLLENSIIKSFKELQRFHDQWKEIGPVPTDKNEDLWERFKSTTDKINQRRREHYKQLQDQHDKNYEAKTGLCEKADQLLATEANTIREWQNKTKQFNELFRLWKTIGPAAKKQNDEIWERFKTTLDAFFNEKKEYFAKLKEQQINNYNLKLDLCVRAEAIKDSDDWRQTSRDMIQMQKEWKEIGPVPRKHSDKIWKRFRAACDEFFNRKSDHFANLRGEENENLRKKEELIKQVEEAAFDGSRSENLDLLKDFQRQWTGIGFVPFKEKDRLQNAFRSAVNKQLDKLNISSSEISIENYKSKMEVLKGSPEGNKSLGRERSFIQGKINQIRDDVNVWENNIGFLADTKKASLFKDEFEKKIEKAKKEIEVLETKLKFLND